MKFFGQTKNSAEIATNQHMYEYIHTCVCVYVYVQIF